MITREVTPAEWVGGVRAAREEGHDLFDWLSAVDQTDAETDAGFDVLCHLIRTDPWQRVLLRTRVAEGEALASITGIFAGAAWHERETHEMFGIEFTDFDDGTDHGMRPLLLPDGFEGTPLRKSFQLAARASKPWPGGKEPGEGSGPTRARARRRLLPPGVPDESWGPR